MIHAYLNIKVSLKFKMLFIFIEHNFSYSYGNKTSLQSKVLLSSIKSLVIINSADNVCMNFSLLIKDLNSDITNKGIPLKDFWSKNSSI